MTMTEDELLADAYGDAHADTVEGPDDWELVKERVAADMFAREWEH